MIIPVPYYSQHIHVTDPTWKRRSCGISCFKMITDFYDADTPHLDALIRVGAERGAYGESGWIHEGLIDLARNYLLEGKRVEFKALGNKDEDLERNTTGVNELVRLLENGYPVLVSTIKKFTEADKFHLVVLVGYETKDDVVTGFYYHDPDATREREGENQFVPIGTFKQAWRRMFLVIYPPQKSPF